MAYNLNSSVYEASHDDTQNKSSVGFGFSITKTSGTGAWSSYACPYSFSVTDETGASVYNKNDSISGYDFRGSTPKTIDLTSGSFTVDHNAEGKRTLNWSFSWTDAGGGVVGSKSSSGSLKLTDIPRKSTITSVDAPLKESNGIAVWFSSASSSFTHTCTISRNSTSISLTKDSSSNVFLYSSSNDDNKLKIFNEQGPGTTKQWTATLNTYSGGTLLGSSTMTFNLTTESLDQMTAIVASSIDNNPLVTINGVSSCKCKIHLETSDGTVVSGNMYKIVSGAQQTVDYINNNNDVQSSSVYLNIQSYESTILSKCSGNTFDLKVVVEDYIGTTKIGTTNSTASFNIKSSKYKPKVSNIQYAIADDNTKLIMNSTGAYLPYTDKTDLNKAIYSKTLFNFKVTSTKNTVTNSEISNYNVIVGKYTYTVSSGSSSTVDVPMTKPVDVRDSEYVEVYIVDKRGLESDHIKILHNINDYYIPSFSDVNIARKPKSIAVEGNDEKVLLNCKINIPGYIISSEKYSIKYQYRLYGSSDDYTTSNNIIPNYIDGSDVVFDNYEFSTTFLTENQYEIRLLVNDVFTNTNSASKRLPISSPLVSKRIRRVGINKIPSAGTALDVSGKIRTDNEIFAEGDVQISSPNNSKYLKFTKPYIEVEVLPAPIPTLTGIYKCGATYYKVGKHSTSVAVGNNLDGKVLVLQGEIPTGYGWSDIIKTTYHDDIDGDIITTLQLSYYNSLNPSIPSNYHSLKFTNNKQAQYMYTGAFVDYACEDGTTPILDIKNSYLYIDKPLGTVTFKATGYNGSPDEAGLANSFTDAQILQLANSIYVSEWQEVTSGIFETLKIVNNQLLINDQLFVGDSLPIGSQMPFAGSVAPIDWMFCNGQAISRTTYADLFAIIGTAYGAGDGSTTFNLPNKIGRVSVGFDSGQTEFNSRGKKGGNKGSNLDVVNSGYGLQAGSGSFSDRIVVGKTGITQSSADNGNLQPYEVDMWIIKVSTTVNGLTTGTTVSVAVDSTTTGAAGTQAAVTNSGSSTDVHLNFTVPKGSSGVYRGTTPPTDPDATVWIDDSDTSGIIPTGGTIGQMLAKASNADYDTKWVDQTGGTQNYTDLTNKPKINNVELTGNKTLTSLGIASESHNHTKSQINDFPTNVSSFTNDSGYLQTHQDISGKVDKVTGKGLSTNDYTTAEKTKLNGLTNYTLPTASTTVLGGVKVGENLSIDSNGVLSATGGSSSDNLIVYTHSSNIVIQPTSLDLATGVYTTNFDLSTISNNQDVLLVPHDDMNAIPVEYFVNNVTFRIQVVSSSTFTLSTTIAEGTNNTTIDATKFHFEIPSLVDIPNVNSSDFEFEMDGLTGRGDMYLKVTNGLATKVGGVSFSNNYGIPVSYSAVHTPIRYFHLIGTIHKVDKIVNFQFNLVHLKSPSAGSRAFTCQTANGVSLITVIDTDNLPISIISTKSDFYIANGTTIRVKKN